MNQLIDETDGSFASRARAAAIALMDEFGLEEFTELTGVGNSDYGIYRIRPKGVSLRASKNLTDLPARQQHAINKLAKLVTLKFPCTPAAFMTWHDATRGEVEPGAPKGEQGRSDFPLAKGFVEQLRRQEGSATLTARTSTPSTEIVAAFRVRPDAGANKRWWNSRLRDPGRCGLMAGRALAGKAQRPSRWYPDVVASWLIAGEYMSRNDVIRAMQQQFSEYDTDLL